MTITQDSNFKDIIYTYNIILNTPLKQNMSRKTTVLKQTKKNNMQKKIHKRLA